MIHFFPTPYQDEIFYSVLARYSVNCEITSYQTIAESLFGKSSARAILELPFNLDTLMQNLPINNLYNADDFIYNHTLYPFFTSFLPPERADEVKKLMLTDGGSKIYCKSGIIGSRFPLRFCPRCIKDDIEKLGEAYWHRAHQIPSTMVCLTHGVLLQDSSVLVRGYNPQAYIPANEENCSTNEIHDYNQNSINRFITLSKDIQELLNNSFQNRPFVWFARQYKERIKELRYSNVNGKVYWDRFVNDFILYYGEEFLNSIHSNVMNTEKKIWVKEVTHTNAKAVHPIRHLLLIRFLGLSLEELFTKELSYKPFGKGPWVCLNPAADHFLEPVVKNLQIKYRRRNKNVNGFFSCSCGYEYMRTLDDEQVRTLKYGDIWITKVRELFQSGITIKEIAIRMNADAETIRKYSKYQSKDKSQIIIQYDSDTSAKLQMYRDKWLLVIKENPHMGRMKLRRISDCTCYWLCKNDREWWEQNTPAPKYIQSDCSIDWANRDASILEVIKSTVQKILASNEKPQRISLRLIKISSQLKSFDLQLDKLPITKAYINTVIETPFDLHKRRIHWAVRKLQEEGKDFGVYTIVEMTGVGNRYRKQVVEEVIRVLDDL